LTGPEIADRIGTDTIFITGYAKLPSSITAAKLYEVIAVGVEIDPNTGIIVECDCTLATTVGRNFLKKLVLGYNLSYGIDDLLNRFEVRYHGSARKAIITALKIMYEKWLAYLQMVKDGEITQ
jgi:hypothetical protein